MNGTRPKLSRVLADGRVGTIVVEDRDRLARLASEHVESALRARQAGAATVPLPSAITEHKELNSRTLERNRRAVTTVACTGGPIG